MAQAAGRLVVDARTLGAVRARLAALPGGRRFDRVLPRRMQRDPEEYKRRMDREAAVCVALCNVDGQASLLFTLRSERVGTHAGQVSFPGGHLEEGEDAPQAALRELYEETAIEASAIAPWHAVRAVTGTMVTPIVCSVERELSSADVAAAASASDEVAEAFALPVRSLCDPAARTMEELSGRWTMPRFQVPGDAHPAIWGLTAFIIDGVLRDVLAPAFNLEYAAAAVADQTSSRADSKATSEL